ncbi:MAG TPA: M56 family metallopeptidase, partial [Planctomycetaceae bacterium]|nr:M56 family metallopeptidase [Planctomycetaceae bacterium]
MILEALFSPPDLPLWLLRLVFSVTLVCMAAALANLLLRRFSAAMRHRVWALGIAASLAMPVMICWSPEVRLGWLKVVEPRATVDSERAPTPGQPAAPTRRFDRRLPAEPARPVSTASRNTVSTDHESIAKTAPLPIPAESKLEVQSDSPAAQPRVATANAASTFPIFRMLDRNTFWILMLIVPAVCGAWQSLRCSRAARRLVEEAQLIQDPATQEIVSDVCRRLGWNHTIELRQTKRMPIPLCVGWWRPCVLLPPGWRSWGDMTLRAVLAHEVSHVVRRDVAWQFVARTACFLYWFHPLVWLAARKMRIERESACDDSVLGMVDQPVDYASVLLRFAREMVARTKPAAAALPMAGLSGLEGRVQAILDKGRRRSPVGTRVSRVFTGAALLIAAGAAALSPLSWEVTEALADTNGHGPLDFFRAEGSVMKGRLTKMGLFGEISGRVVLKSEPGRGASRARILGIPENPKAAYVTAVADAQGYFHVPRVRSAMLFLAQNDERTLAGISRFDGQEIGVSISVGNSVSANGRLLDATGKPLASWPIEYCLVLDGAFLDEYHVFQTRDAKRLLGGSASTGPNGEFTLTGLAPGWTYRISCCPGTMVNGV